MISWMHIIDVGHTAVMIPVAGAIAVWLVAAKAWKLVVCWGVIFAAGLGLVAMSKIAYLGWGVEIQSIGFKALSGHAWRASAVLPVLFFLLLQTAPRTWRSGGVLLGIVSSLGLAALLVVFSFHTASEVMASLVLGLAASLSFIRVAVNARPLRASPWAAPAGLLAFVMIWGLDPSSVTPRLVDLALYFSGRDHPYRWSQSPGRNASPSYEPEGAGKQCRTHVRY